ncbi:unnamed protein product [Neospora caninum Liverpool]|uniref:28 kDa antigen, putative n=2 Tax=Neospora caninum TaxID=29176 RepID=F0VLK5_NEOCL|nr:uncharacterized protein NCLIV_045650 [Neospora caninum Liverpool]AAG28489.1 GRA2 protein [Neospora caninum]CBZ54133.1 unnamed protein product [Neospora caninum Liverpool]CEL68832.1 TPA: 28 kDa antigen, putative [Neospora caninum Liverpool]|eukprot:XP_003884164.1 uncharacterized protein NCLIV_045650 [Neospora caninum Liverpool]
MFTGKRWILVVAVGALVGASVKAADFSGRGTVNGQPVGSGYSGYPRGDDVRESMAAPEDLPGERQPETPTAEAVKQAAAKAYRLLKQFTAKVGQETENAYYHVKKATMKGFDVAKDQSYKGYLAVRKATAKGLQSAGKSLELKESAPTGTTTAAPTEKVPPSGPRSGEVQRTRKEQNDVQQTAEMLAEEILEAGLKKDDGEGRGTPEAEVN